MKKKDKVRVVERLSGWFDEIGEVISINGDFIQVKFVDDFVVDYFDHELELAE